MLCTTKYQTDESILAQRGYAAAISKLTNGIKQRCRNISMCIWNFYDSVVQQISGKMRDYSINGA